MEKDKEMEELEQQISSCQKCTLWKGRTHVVMGGGSLRAKIMFIGEAPGFHEDRQGVPFVGKAGKVLDELLGSVGLTREEVYIANILKCRPPNNRNPLQSEIRACTPYLDKQLHIIRPSVLATLGNFSLSYVCETFGVEIRPIGKVHGSVIHVPYQHRDIALIPLYHPAAAVYNPKMMSLLVEDFKVIARVLGKQED